MENPTVIVLIKYGGGGTDQKSLYVEALTIGVSSAVSASGCVMNRWTERRSDLLKEGWVEK